MHLRSQNYLNHDASWAVPAVRGLEFVHANTSSCFVICQSQGCDGYMGWVPCLTQLMARERHSKDVLFGPLPIQQVGYCLSILFHGVFGIVFCCWLSHALSLPFTCRPESALCLMVSSSCPHGTYLFTAIFYGLIIQSFLMIACK